MTAGESPIRKVRRLVGLLAEAFRRFQTHSGTYLGAAIAYYALSSLFPFLLGIIAVLGVVFEAEQVRAAVLGQATAYLPGSETLVLSALDEATRARGAVGLVSVALLLWSATGVVGAVSWAINRALEAETPRPFLRQKLVEIGAVLGAGFFLWGSTLMLGAIRLLGSLIALPGVSSGTYLLGAALSVALSFGIFALAYRFLAAVPLRWADIWPGAAFAALGVEVGKHLFLLYLERFASFNLVYGSVGAALAFLLWSYLAAVVVIFGAELVALHRRTDKAPRPEGQP